MRYVSLGYVSLGYVSLGFDPLSLMVQQIQTQTFDERLQGIIAETRTRIDEEISSLWTIDAPILAASVPVQSTPGARRLLSIPLLHCLPPLASSLIIAP
jgi:hypothetical protein